MRRILVDHARRRAAHKRGGGARAEELRDTLQSAGGHSPELLLAIDEALRSLAQREPRQARVVELRFFSGLSDEESAHVLGVSTRTVKRDWRLAKAWLYFQLKDPPP
jgi:RNA polymerase sigma factor (TIGR02999 family)